MKYSLFRRFFILAGLGLFLTGCSSIINSHRQKEPMMTAYIAADNAAVRKEINAKLKSTRNTGDELMWHLEAGSMNFYTGNFSGSIEQFKTAEKLIGEYDDRAKISVRDIGAETGTVITNLNTLPYRGLCRDRIALSIYKSLAYLGMNSESSFHAQLRRLRQEQKKVQHDYQEFFKAEKAELDKIKKKNPEYAQRADKEFSADKLAENPQNADFAAELTEIRKVANRGYGFFLNPAAIFLSGLGSLREGNDDNARIDFQRLYEAMPRNPMIRQYYVTLLQKTNRPVPAVLAKVNPFRFPLDRDCVYVLFANGRSAAFKQTAIYFPIMAAWPMCEFYPAPFDRITVTADKAAYPSQILADMDGILAQEFNERLPGIITRTVLNTLIKDGAYYSSLALVGSSGMDPVAKCLTICAIAIGGAGYRAAMNTADTRSWELLSKEFQLTQFPMPENRTLRVQFGSSGIIREVRIPSDCRSAIVFVNAPGVQNISCHVFPLKEK